MRLTREEFFIEVAQLTARRSTCSRANVGAVIVKDKRIISCGYNGAISGSEHCYHSPGDGSSCRVSVHAEANAIAFAARNGISVSGGGIYCTHSPCLYCAQIIINAGLSTLDYLNPYRDPAGLKLLMEVIEVRRWTHNNGKWIRILVSPPRFKEANQ